MNTTNTGKLTRDEEKSIASQLKTVEDYATVFPAIAENHAPHYREKLWVQVLSISPQSLRAKYKTLNLILMICLIPSLWIAFIFVVQTQFVIDFGVIKSLVGIIFLGYTLKLISEFERNGYLFYTILAFMTLKSFPDDEASTLKIAVFGTLLLGIPISIFLCIKLFPKVSLMSKAKLEIPTTK